MTPTTVPPTHFSKVGFYIWNTTSYIHSYQLLDDHEVMLVLNSNIQKIDNICEAVDPLVMELPVYKALSKLYDNYNPVALYYS